MIHLLRMFSLLSLLLFLGSGCVLGVSQEQTPPVIPPTEDIIYGTSQDPEDLERWNTECTAQGGTFNECGSSCPDPSTYCPAVCAARCEF